MFQCLLIAGENQGEEALRNAEQLVVTDQEFQSFLDRHSSVDCLVPESNIQVRISHFAILHIYFYEIVIITT